MGECKGDMETTIGHLRCRVESYQYPASSILSFPNMVPYQGVGKVVLKGRWSM